MFFWNMLICFGVLWIIQSFLSFMQGIYVKNTINALSTYGKVFMGKNPGFLRTKVIVLAAVNSHDTIVKANKIRPAKILRMPKILDFDELSGINISSAYNKREFDPFTISALTDLKEKYTLYLSKKAREA